VSDIEDAMAALQSVIEAAAFPSSPRYDASRGGGKDPGAVLGGDALATLVGGSPDAASSRDERDGDPRARQVLESWAAWWRELRDEPGRGNLADTCDYLRSRSLWAAQSFEEWPDYLTELREVRREVRHIIGVDTTPVREVVPCVHCGATITREWTEQGLADLRQCRGCGLTWIDAAHLAFINRDTLLALPATHPDVSVTMEQARKVWPKIPRNTWNQALGRDQRKADAWDAYLADLRTSTWTIPQPKHPRRHVRIAPERGTDERGDVLYRLGDLARIAERITAGIGRKAKTRA
jgi:hypothetical protein